MDLPSTLDIKDLIPQRTPFLFIDSIVDFSQDQIIVDYVFHKNLDFFKGHFPENPIVPGVILNEACFQSAAALMAIPKDISSIATMSPTNELEIDTPLAVVSRIQSAKFKAMVRPDDKIIITTKLVERLENAAYFKSAIKNLAGKKVSTVDFACTLVSE